MLPRPTRVGGLSMVGIPTFNEAATVRAVAEAADAGLADAFPDGPNVIVLADNGSTDDTVERFNATTLRARKVAVLSPGPATGKGTNVLAIIDRALDLGAQRLVLLDGDLRSAQPGWIRALSAAVDDPSPTIALPMYRRNRYEANSTNHLVRPLLAATFGSTLEQPIGGDFAFNAAFLRRVVHWTRPASAQLYGIDVWLTANALRQGLRIAQVPLGRKMHNSPFPKILHLPQQVLDALFHVVAGLGRPRSMPPLPPPGHAVDAQSHRQDPAIVSHVMWGVRGYLRAHHADIEQLLPSARSLPGAPWGVRVDTAAWPALIAEALCGLVAGEFERSRDHLIAMFVSRVLTFWEEIAGLDGAGVDELLDRQARDTAAEVHARGITFDGPAGPGHFEPGRWSAYQSVPATPKDAEAARPGRREDIL